MIYFDKCGLSLMIHLLVVLLVLLEYSCLILSFFLGKNVQIFGVADLGFCFPSLSKSTPWWNGLKSYI
jgi:hypothetical protein